MTSTQEKFQFHFQPLDLLNGESISTESLTDEEVWHMCAFDETVACDVHLKVSKICEHFHFRSYTTKRQMELISLLLAVQRAVDNASRVKFLHIFLLKYVLHFASFVKHVGQGFVQAPSGALGSGSSR